MTTKLKVLRPVDFESFHNDKVQQEKSKDNKYNLSRMWDHKITAKSGSFVYVLCYIRNRDRERVFIQKEKIISNRKAPFQKSNRIIQTENPKYGVKSHIKQYTYDYDSNLCILPTYNKYSEYKYHDCCFRLMLSTKKKDALAKLNALNLLIKTEENKRNRWW